MPNGWAPANISRCITFHQGGLLTFACLLLSHCPVSLPPFLCLQGACAHLVRLISTPVIMPRQISYFKILPPSLLMRTVLAAYMQYCPKEAHLFASCSINRCQFNGESDVSEQPCCAALFSNNNVQCTSRYITDCLFIELLRHRKSNDSLLCIAIYPSDY